MSIVKAAQEGGLNDCEHAKNLATTTAKHFAINWVRHLDTREAVWDKLAEKRDSAVECEETEHPLWRLALKEALEELVNKDRKAHEAFVLRFVEGLSNEEVAARLKVSIYVASRRWTSALGFLRDHLWSDEDQDS